MEKEFKYTVRESHIRDSWEDACRLEVFLKPGFTMELQLSALKSIQTQRALCIIARCAPDAAVRGAALERLDMGEFHHPLFLAEVLVADASALLRLFAARRMWVSPVLHFGALWDGYAPVRRACLERTVDRDILLLASRRDPDGDNRDYAAGRLAAFYPDAPAQGSAADEIHYHQNGEGHWVFELPGDAASPWSPFEALCLKELGLLRHILLDEEAPSQAAAVEESENTAVLCATARAAKNSGVRREAIRKMRDWDALSGALACDADPQNRILAIGDMVFTPAVLYGALYDGDPGVRYACLQTNSIKEILALAAQRETNAKNGIYAAEKLLRLFGHEERYRTLARDALRRFPPQQEPADEAPAPKINHKIFLHGRERKKEVLLKEIEDSTDEAFLEDAALEPRNDWQAREKAARKIEDPERLLSIALSDAPACGLHKIRDAEMLKEIAFRSASKSTRKDAIRRLDDDALLVKVVEADEDYDVRREAAGALRSPALRAHFALLDRDWLARRAAACAKEPDTGVLVSMAADDENSANRLFALEALLSSGQEAHHAVTQPQWLKIAMAHPEYREAALRATGQLTWEELLLHLALESPDRCVRNTALHRLRDTDALLTVAQHGKDDALRASADYRTGAPPQFPSIAAIGIGASSLPALRRLAQEGLPELHLLCLEDGICFFGIPADGIRRVGPSELSGALAGADFIVSVLVLDEWKNPRDTLDLMDGLLSQGFPTAAIMGLPAEIRDDRARQRVHDAAKRYAQETRLLVPLVGGLHDTNGADVCAHAVQTLLAPLYGGMPLAAWQEVVHRLGPVADFVSSRFNITKKQLGIESWGIGEQIGMGHNAIGSAYREAPKGPCLIHLSGTEDRRARHQDSMVFRFPDQLPGDIHAYYTQDSGTWADSVGLMLNAGYHRELVEQQALCAKQIVY